MSDFCLSFMMCMYPAAFLTRDGGCGGSCMKQSALKHFLILAQEYLQDPVNTTLDTMQMVNG